MTDLVVREVQTAGDFRAFATFPWAVYRDDPNWVPPLVFDWVRLLDKKRNPSWEYLDGAYFLAERDGEPVGMIAAFVNPRYNERWGEKVGWFGAFEVYKDVQVAKALLNRAAAWVRERGCVVLRGPMTFTTQDLCGLLVDGFKRPAVLTPYNPPYYQTLLEVAGFEKVMDTYDVEWTRDDADAYQRNMARLGKLADRIQSRRNIRIIAARPDDLRPVFKDLYNACWHDNWGFVPITDHEMEAMEATLGPFITPQTCSIASINDVPVGFIVVLPDFNEALRKAYPRPGKPDFLAVLRVLWMWRVRRSLSKAHVTVLGVRPAYRDMGVANLLLYHQLRRITDGSPEIQEVSAGWILETNRELLRICESFGGRIAKTYRFYERLL